MLSGAVRSTGGGGWRKDGRKLGYVEQKTLLKLQ
jgi:hypothetical protein